MTQRNRTGRNGHSATITEDNSPVDAGTAGVKIALDRTGDAGGRSPDDSSVRMDAIAQSPMAADELVIVPRLGPARRKMLSEAGIETLDDLRTASIEELAQIKYVGLGNARLIKAWLEQYDAEAAIGETRPSDGLAAVSLLPPPPPDLKISGSTENRTWSQTEAAPESHPRVPPEGRGRLSQSQADVRLASGGEEFGSAALPLHGLSDEQGHVTTDSPLLEASSPRDDRDSGPTGVEYERIATIDRAVATLKDRLPKKERHPKLTKQLQRMGSSLSKVRTHFTADEDETSDTPERGPSHASSPQGDAPRIEAVGTLTKISNVLVKAQAKDRLSAKKQKSLGTKLRKLRKRLNGLTGK